MNHQQMAQMAYTFICKAGISGADAEAVVECKQWLQAIGIGQFVISDREEELTQGQKDAREAMDKANGEDASPDGPEGDAAPG